MDVLFTAVKHVVDKVGIVIGVAAAAAAVIVIIIILYRKRHHLMKLRQVVNASSFVLIV